MVWKAQFESCLCHIASTSVAENRIGAIRNMECNALVESCLYYITSTRVVENRMGAIWCASIVLLSLFSCTLLFSESATKSSVCWVTTQHRYRVWLIRCGTPAMAWVSPLGIFRTPTCIVDTRKEDKSGEIMMILPLLEVNIKEWNRSLCLRFLISVFGVP